MRFTHRGPEARGCVNRAETEPRDITDLYHGLCGLDNCNVTTAALAIKDSRAYLATQTICHTAVTGPLYSGTLNVDNALPVNVALLLFHSDLSPAIQLEQYCCLCCVQQAAARSVT